MLVRGGESMLGEVGCPSHVSFKACSWAQLTMVPGRMVASL